MLHHHTNHRTNTLLKRKVPILVFGSLLVVWVVLSYNLMFQIDESKVALSREKYGVVVQHETKTVSLKRKSDPRSFSHEKTDVETARMKYEAVKKKRAKNDLDDIPSVVLKVKKPYEKQKPIPKQRKSAIVVESKKSAFVLEMDHKVSIIVPTSRLLMEQAAQIAASIAVASQGQGQQSEGIGTDTDIAEIIIVVEGGFARMDAQIKMETMVNEKLTRLNFDSKYPAIISLLSSDSYIQMISDGVKRSNSDYCAVISPHMTHQSAESAVQWLRDSVSHFDDYNAISFITPLLATSSSSSTETTTTTSTSTSSKAKAHWNTVLSTGIEFAPSALKTSNTDLQRPTLVEAYRMFSGVSILDSRLKSRKSSFPDPLCFAMRKNVWDAFGGDGSLGPVLSIADAVLSLESEKGLTRTSIYLSSKPLYFSIADDADVLSFSSIDIPVSADSLTLTPSTPSMPNKNKKITLTRTLTPDVIEFGRRWGFTLTQHVSAFYGNLEGVNVVWDSFCGCTGFGLETVSFAVALEHYVSLQVIGDPDTCFCHGLPSTDMNALRRMTSKRFQDVTIMISHKPPPNYPSKWPYEGTVTIKHRPRYIIGRSMTETTKLRKQWVKAIEVEKRVNEVWVPTRFMRDVFVTSGVAASKVRVIPIPFDVHLFDPSLYATDATDKNKNTYHKSLSKAGLDKHSSSFKFISVFKWEQRKGWDVLLSAYFREFKATDPVVLVLHTYAYKAFGNPRDPSLLKRKIAGFVRNVMYREHEKEKEKEDFVKVEVEEKNVSADEQRLKGDSGSDSNNVQVETQQQQQQRQQQKRENEEIQRTVGGGGDRKQSVTQSETNAKPEKRTAIENDNGNEADISSDDEGEGDEYDWNSDDYAEEGEGEDVGERRLLSRRKKKSKRSKKSKSKKSKKKGLERKNKNKSKYKKSRNDKYGRKQDKKVSYSQTMSYKPRVSDDEILAKLPPIIIHTTELPLEDMPLLYAPMDSFVLPSRGEGWCMPVMEAMSMELPVITTNFSGPTEYLTQENSYPLDAGELTPVTDSEVGTGLWASPSVSHLQQLMREVYTDKAGRVKRGKKAREDVVSQYSREAVASVVRSRLSSIVGNELHSGRSIHSEDTEDQDQN